MLPTHIRAWLETGQPLDCSIRPMGLGQMTSCSLGDMCIAHWTQHCQVLLSVLTSPRAFCLCTGLPCAGLSLLFCMCLHPHMALISLCLLGLKPLHGTWHLAIGDWRLSIWCCQLGVGNWVWAIGCGQLGVGNLGESNWM